MDDISIVELLFERTESALDEVARKYAPLYHGVLREILGDERDVEECANDVLLAVWNSIPPNRPDGLAAYICKLTRRIGIDRFRYNTRQMRHTGYTVSLTELEECLPVEVALPVEADNEELKRVLAAFLRDMEPEAQVLFLRRYVYLESVSDLATRFDMSPNHVAVRLYRARKALKKRLEKEGIYL